MGALIFTYNQSDNDTSKSYRIIKDRLLIWQILQLSLLAYAMITNMQHAKTIKK